MINNESIKTTNSAKYLGVMLDKYIKFDYLIANMVSKISRSVGIMTIGYFVTIYLNLF